LLSLEPVPLASQGALDFLIAGTLVHVDAPTRIMNVVRAMLANVPHSGSHLLAAAKISVLPDGDAWDILGSDGSRTVMSAKSPLPRVGGAVVSRIINIAAEALNYAPMRATVVERAGQALAMIGDDWESAITIAAHLHGRGWSFIGGDNALFDPASGKVFPVQKSLYVNSSSVLQLPARYRRAVEASPWYATPQGISFYAVDPSSANLGQAWRPSALLSKVLVVDGAMADSPSLEAINTSRLSGDRFAQSYINWASVELADLRIGPFIETCDLIEHWFGTGPS
jgi:hypothetical protein